MTDLAAELAAERAARAAAERRNEIHDRFLAILAHELQSPLATLLLWARLLRDPGTTPEIRAQAIDVIHDSALAQSRLIGELLELARARERTLRITCVPLAIGPLIADAIARALPAAAAREIAIAHAGAGELAAVSGDAARLAQALDAVLAHAIAARPPGGRIDVTARVAGGAIAIAIGDGGVGPIRRDDVFDPAAALREPGDGPRLALALARELIALHGGSLTAASRGPGHGATFAMSLPVTAATPAPTPARAPDLARVRVLLVDDDRWVRDALAHLLRRAGAIVEAVGSATEARSAIDGAPFDIAICDIEMPGEDGHALLDGLRRRGYEVPAIALTAHAGADAIRRSRGVGFDAHLTKPIAFDQLRAVIAKLVANRNTRADET